MAYSGIAGSDAIPSTAHLADTDLTLNVALDRADPRHKEPMRDVRDEGIAGENYYARMDGQNPPYFRHIKGSITALYVRAGLLFRLKQANQLLKPKGLELFVFDGYRPIACQVGLWNHFLASLRAQHPEDNRAKIEEKARIFVSDPTSFDPEDDQTCPVHATGGAVDLTIRRIVSREFLPMGTHFDQMHERSSTSYYERCTNQGDGWNDVLLNRRLLYWTMIAVGFTNYENEYWHYDYGDKFYAASLLCSGKSNSKSYWYGYVATDELPS